MAKIYCITGVIHKFGGAPVTWTYYSARRLSQTQCEDMLSRAKEVGRSYASRVKLTEFKCERIKP